MGSYNDLKYLWCLLAGIVISPGVMAQISLPDSARPGAVRPEEVGEPAIPEVETTPVLEVPAVIDRPFEIDEGPHVVVKRFRLLDARDMPKFDVSLTELEELLQKMIDEKPEGFTIGQLDIVASDITRYYREKGLILSQAVVPVQTVQNGIVDIQVLEGRLGRVVVEGNTMYSEKKLQSPFKGLVGRPVTKDEIETALLRLTDYPGLSVFGVFQPGIQVGTADIVLRVQEEKRFDVGYRVDNHGLQETGRFRFRPTIDWNNPTGGADRLSATLQQTYEPRNNTFFAFDYERHLGYGFRGLLNFNRNSFDVGGELALQEIHGETEQMGVSLEKNWIRGRTLNLFTNLGLERKESTTTVRRRLTNRDRLTVANVGLSFDSVDTRFQGINFVTLDFYHGFDDLFGAMGSGQDATFRPAGSRPSRQGGPPDRRFASGKFNKVFARASRLQSINTRFLNMTVLLVGEFQWSRDLLVPMEQYSVGGPDNVRAYPQAQFLLDRAVFGSIEFIHNLPFIGDKPAFGNRTWGELVQISAFYDHAHGRLNQPLSTDEQDNINFRGAGFQIRFNLPGTLESRIMAAWNLEDKTEFQTPDNRRQPQLWGDLTYRF